MGTRKEQKEKRRNDILEAGLDLFIHKGYASTKISDIAERVGMSTGLLFHYFASKEKLYEELIKYGMEGPLSMIAPTDKEPLEFFSDVAKQIFTYIQTQPFFTKMFVLMSQVYFNESAPQSVKEMLSGFDIYTPTTLLIKKGQDNGTIRQGNPYALALAFWSAIQGIALQTAMEPGLPCPEGEWVVDIIRRKA